MLFEYLFNSNRDRGVSPVIGVIFMVAAVVIIAASIGVTVLDTADGVSDPTPQVKFDVEETDSGMKITHTLMVIQSTVIRSDSPVPQQRKQFLNGREKPFQLVIQQSLRPPKERWKSSGKEETKIVVAN